MPGGDGTGPMGMGQMTGRGAGFCAGYPVAGFVNPVFGRGFGGFGQRFGRGFGRGGGWGRRNWFYATGLPGWQRTAMGYPPYGLPAQFGMPYNPSYAQEMTKEEEVNELKAQAEYLKDALENVKQRMAGIEEQTKTE